MTTAFNGAFRAFSSRTGRSLRSFRSVFSILTVVSLVSATGCGLLKKKGVDDAGTDDDATAADAAPVDAAPPPAAAPIAANVDDVARFPDEKAIDNVAATLQRTTNVREIPSVGKIVASLAKGGSVTQVASRGTAFLVLFDNPKDQKRLMGWVGQEAFTASVTDAGIKPLVCSAPDVPLLSDGPFCGRTCTQDADCPGGQACKGAANRFANAKLGDAVTVCTVFTAARPAATVAPTAAPTVVIPVPATDIAPASGGRCAVGFTLVGKDLKCHKNCIIGQCQGGNKCAPCQGGNVCATTTAFCK